MRKRFSSVNYESLLFISSHLSLWLLFCSFFYWFFFRQTVIFQMQRSFLEFNYVHLYVTFILIRWRNNLLFRFRRLFENCDFLTIGLFWMPPDLSTFLTCEIAAGSYVTGKEDLGLDCSYWLFHFSHKIVNLFRLEWYVLDFITIIIVLNVCRKFYLLQFCSVYFHCLINLFHPMMIGSLPTIE